MHVSPHIPLSQLIPPYMSKLTNGHIYERRQQTFYGMVWYMGKMLEDGKNVQYLVVREAFNKKRSKLGIRPNRGEGVYPDPNLLTGFLKILRMP